MKHWGSSRCLRWFLVVTRTQCRELQHAVISIVEEPCSLFSLAFVLLCSLFGLPLALARCSVSWRRPLRLSVCLCLLPVSRPRRTGCESNCCYSLSTMNSLRKVCSAAAIVPRHARRFGGDRRYRHPEIYSPAGGWWNTNPNAKRNTLIAAGVIASIATPIALTSMQLEVCFVRQIVEACPVLPPCRVSSTQAIDSPVCLLNLHVVPSPRANPHHDYGSFRTRVCRRPQRALVQQISAATEANRVEGATTKQNITNAKHNQCEVYSPTYTNTHFCTAVSYR